MNNTWKIYMLTFISFMVGTSQFIISGILDQVAASVGVSVSTAGQLITVFALGNAIGTPLIMMVTAKMDRRNQLLLSLAIILFGTVSTLIIPGFGFLMVSRAILGLGTGVFIVTAYSIAANLAPEGRKVSAMSNVAMGASASLVLGVPIGRVIAGATDWKTIFWGIGILCVIAIFTVARTIPRTEGEEPVPLTKQLALLKNLKIAVALSVTFFMFISYSMVNTYITPLLLFVLKGSEQGISMILFALGIASLAGSKLGGFSADRFGGSRTLVVAMGIQALVLAVFSSVSGSVVLSITLLMLWGVSAWMFGPTQNYYLVSLAPEASGIMLSLNSSFVQLGFAAGAGIGGMAVGGSSIMVITWIGAVSVALAATIAAVSFGSARSLSSARG